MSTIDTGIDAWHHEALGSTATFGDLRAWDVWRRMSGTTSRLTESRRLSSTIGGSRRSARDTRFVSTDPSRAVRAAVSRAGGTRPVMPGVTVSGMQKWQGLVTDVDEDLFTARLTPLTDGAAEVVADFERQLLAEDDVEAGDIIYVTVRIIREHSRRAPTKTQSVRLSRMGRWTEDDVTAISVRARRDWQEVAEFAE